jgi:hypothetical protein
MLLRPGQTAVFIFSASLLQHSDTPILHSHIRTSSQRSVWRLPQIQLEDFIFRSGHAELLVRSARAGVIGVHVKPQPHGALCARHVLYVLEKSAKDPRATELRSHIDALQPPEIPISPIAPFVSDHKLADHFARGFGDKVEAFGRVLEQGGNAGLDAARLQAQILGLDR